MLYIVYRIRYRIIYYKSRAKSKQIFIKMDKTRLQDALIENVPETVELLSRLIAFPTVRGQGREIGPYLEERMGPLGDSAGLIPLPDSLADDPDFTFKLLDSSLAGLANFRVFLAGAGGGKSLALNTHMDVVPPSPGQSDAFNPRVENGTVFGRGACDAKGQIAILWLVLKTLRDLGLRPTGDLTADIVVEEESGGNGTLLVVRRCLYADGAVILEPTDLHVAHLVRGAVWFDVRTRGKAGHSGSPGTTISALKEAVRAMSRIEAVREELLAVSRKAVPKIAAHPDPMPCTFGVLNSGVWPAAAPSEAVLKGVFGFLPPFHRQEIQARLRQAVDSPAAEVRFNMLNSDPSFVPEDHALVRLLLEAARECGLPSRPEFMNASCDSWRYSEQLRIPAVVFGGGSIATAHAVDEQIGLDDLRRAAETLILFIDKWSGLRHA